MTSSVAEHYARHLGPIYSWMVGDFEGACAHADAFYSNLGLPPGNDALAIDLGCGHGVHAVPLARRGYRVLAIDNCTRLLNELHAAAADLPIRIAAGDLSDFRSQLKSESASLIACMGDTLTHLPSVEAVDRLIRDAALSLAPQGVLALSFRDYATQGLTGRERFIPVRSDEQRIHICFLDYQAELVLVHDIIHSWVDKSWQTSISAYPKIRLQPETVIAIAQSQGLSMVHRSVDHGMLYLAFRHVLN